MPVTPTYPGVYVEELPSGVRTITGVATSITAFLGRAVRGPVNVPQTIFSFSDYERLYAGLHPNYPMSYAVRDFFLNGGGQAVIVRLAGTGNPLSATNRPTLFADDERTAGEAAITAIFGVIKKDDTLVTDPIVAAELARVQQVGRATAEVHRTAASCQTQRLELGRTMGHLTNAQVACATAISMAQQLELLLIANPTDTALERSYQQAVSLREQHEHEAHTAEEASTTAKDALEHAQNDLDQASRIVQVVLRAGVAAVREVEKALVSEPTSNLPTPADVLLAVSQASSPTGTSSNAAKATVQLSALELTAKDEGTWANELQARIMQSSVVDHYVLEIGKSTEQGKDPLVIERLDYLVVDKDSPRNIAQVVESESRYVKVKGDPTALVLSGWVPFGGGSDGGMLKPDEYTLKAVLDAVDLFNLLCIPPDDPTSDLPSRVLTDALDYCVKRRAMLIVDPPTGWSGANDITASQNKKLTDLNVTGTAARNAILYFPRVKQSDPLHERQERTVAACGIIAGVIARTDRDRGVWKAPAGTDAAISGIRSLQYTLIDEENGQLNPLGINCLRTFPLYGTVIWGARTMRGADQFADDYKYIPVRRLALYIEESLYRGLKWVVFEPNDEPLWSQIRLNVGSFMNTLFRQGAFKGQTPREAYFVKCDKETTTQNDINLGIVNVVVGFAPLKPAEFVIVKLQQMAGQIAV